MITPAELANEAKRYDEQQQRDIETDIDKALIKSSVKPGGTFTYFYYYYKSYNVEAVAERYRAAGWAVVPGAFCLVFTAPAPSE
jgi:hypothetical protein